MAERPDPKTIRIGPAKPNLEALARSVGVRTTERPTQIERTPEDIARFHADMERIAASLLGRKGGAAGTGASKRRDVDYPALGRKGGQAGKGKRKPRE